MWQDHAGEGRGQAYPALTLQTVTLLCSSNRAVHSSQPSLSKRACTELNQSAHHQGQDGQRCLHACMPTAAAHLPPPAGTSVHTGRRYRSRRGRHLRHHLHAAAQDRSHLCGGARGGRARRARARHWQQGPAAAWRGGAPCAAGRSGDVAHPHAVLHHRCGSWEVVVGQRGSMAVQSCAAGRPADNVQCIF
jgi:hypothetical protein